MKFLRRISIFLLLLYLTGAVSENAYGVNMITQVQVVCRNKNTALIRQYDQPHKIEAVLNYLRLLKCSGSTTADPEQLTGNTFEIILYDTTGQRSIYRQRADRFISKNSKPWERISPGQASLLYALIQSMPTDKQPQSKKTCSAV